jgi:hypothetical protein
VVRQLKGRYREIVAVPGIRLQAAADDIAGALGLVE